MTKGSEGRPRVLPGILRGGTGAFGARVLKRRQRKVAAKAARRKNRNKRSG